MRLARAVFLASTVAFVVLSIWAFRRRVDAASHERYARALADLRALNSHLNETVLRKRIDVGGNYDAMTATLGQLGQVHAQLRAVPGFLPESSRAEVKALVDESEGWLRRRQKTVERFETENAAFEASLRILRDDTASVASRGEGERGRRLADRANALRVEVLALVASRAEGHKAAVDAALEALRAESGGWAEDDRQAAERLMNRVKRAMERVIRLKALVDEIVTPASAQHASALTSSYVSAVESARSAWNLGMAGLFALALCMISSAASYVIGTLRRSAAELSSASAELEAALAQLTAERAKEKELSELKTRFVAMTSHEFRTPLSIISSSAELLQNYGERWAPEKRGEHLARIRRSVRGMTTMLDRILLIGRAEAGLLEFRPSLVSLDKLLAEIASEMAMADGQKHRLEVDLAPEIDDARADEKLLRHALENLLSNALKYSPEGSAVRLEARREGDFVVMVVRDSGIGIPEKDRARLFEGFHRADNALHIAGTGLGLSVVKRAVELHGGGLVLESAVGRGTTFTVRVRAEREER